MKKSVIEKWYKILNFPKEYTEDFYALLKATDCEDITDINGYADSSDKGKNLLAYLYFCESVSEKYKKLGIPEEILIDTLYDLVVWTKTYYDMTGKVGFAQTGWLKWHMSFKLFKLGRLQFAFDKAECDIEAYSVKRGDDILAVHIAEVGPLDIDECLKSFENAKNFFKKYFPEYNYKCFTCHSWLLDEGLGNYLRENSNILRFAALFKNIKADESDALLKYIFRRDATRENLDDMKIKSSFAQKIYDAVKCGETFYEVLGARKIQ